MSEEVPVITISREKLIMALMGSGNEFIRCAAEIIQTEPARLQQARNEALEEAARMAEEWGFVIGWGDELAAAIRKLRSDPE